MSTRDFARSMAVQQIGYWRHFKRNHLPRTAADSRREALWWLAQAKRYPK